MTMPARAARAERASVTRELILATAERLFAKHGVITSKHSEQVERLREQMLTEVGGSTDLRDWVTCSCARSPNIWPPLATSPGMPGLARR